QFANIQALVDLWELSQGSPAQTSRSTAEKSSPPLPGLKDLWYELLDAFLSQDYLHQPARHWLEQVFAQFHKKRGIKPEALAGTLLSSAASTVQSQPH